MSWDTTSAVWSQTHVRRGIPKTGYWLIDVEQPGRYEISLRRWPVEANLPITAGCPKHPMEEENCWSGSWPEGVALPIRSAQLSMGDFEQTKPVTREAVAVTFEVELETGPNRIDALFLDESEDVLCSAYFTSVERKAGETSDQHW